MALRPVFRTVALSEIDLDDHAFVVTYRPPLQELERSVARAGVLTPVHLRAFPGKAQLQVVCGYKRLLACQQTGRQQVPALVHQALSEEEALWLAVHDNLGTRAFNAVEKGRILRRLRDAFGYSPGRLAEEVCPLLTLPPRRDTVEAYCTLAALEEPLPAAVVEGALPLEAALWIGRHQGADREALLALFTGLKLSSSRARELATFIDEICRRERCSAAALLQRLGVTAVLAEAGLDGPQKLERVRRLLYEARYPQLSAHEQRFREALRRLRLPPQVSLRPPPYFEGQQYQVSFPFGTRQELARIAERLQAAAADAALDELLALL
ncbi:MAG: hypothetical protein KatS3mg131_0978 [Candidatus Tectimicrobiota bacterium]|nr:MAG: hypothetical protein KatS3mg131_0978 [Candidatus Tectomicrobia bacterium]